MEKAKTVLLIAADHELGEGIAKRLAVEVRTPLDLCTVDSLDAATRAGGSVPFDLLLLDQAVLAGEGQPSIALIDLKGPLIVFQGAELAGQAPDSRPDSLVAGPVRIEGIARIPPPRGWLRPDNQPEENLWFWIDLPAMAAYAGAPTVVPLVVEAGPGGAPEALPVEGQSAIDIPNNHLQYALTWFSLAAALLAIYILYHWRQSGRTPDEG